MSASQKALYQSASRLILAIFIFLGLASLSYLNHILAFTITAAYLLGMVLILPRLAWAFLIFLVPFQFLFHFDNWDFSTLVALLLLGLALKFAPVLMYKDFHDSRFLLILSTFILLAVFHFQLPFRFTEYKALLFLISLPAPFLVSRMYGADENSVKLVQMSFLFSALAIAILSFLFLFVPIPELIHYHVPIDNLRLIGVTDNPNTVARFMIPALALLVALSPFGRGARMWLLFSVFAGFCLLAMTASKSVILSITVTCTVVFYVFNRNVGRHWQFWAMASLICVAYVIWFIFAGPVLQYRAASHWKSVICGGVRSTCNGFGTRSARFPAEYLDAPPSAKSAEEKLVSRLRIGISSDMEKSSEGKTIYFDRPFDLLKTGQRDRLWKAGVAVVMEHPLWGIGYKQWPVELQKKLNYPFISPHNAILELVGEFGVVGGVLYIMLVVMFVRNFLSLAKTALEDWQKQANCWIFLSGVTILLVELVDVATTMAVTLYMVWFWTILGLQEAIAHDVTEKKKGTNAGTP